MPIYEYRCTSCGCEKEYLQKISDSPMKTCPGCGQDALTKLISAAGFQLKGSGWYATDFKGSGKGKTKSDAKPGEGAKEAKPESGSTSSGDAAPSATGSHACGGGCSCA